MPSKRMGTSNIGYVGEDGIRPYGWNPGGFGCSAGCPGCWAREFAERGMSKCEKCRRFEVHLHDERLRQPEGTARPGVVLVDFTCDTFDKERPDADVRAILSAAARANRHIYVWLTKQPDRMGKSIGRLDAEFHPFTLCRDNWHLGLTIRHQQDADEKLPVFLEIPGNLWISYEPATGPVNWQRGPTNEPGAIVPEVYCENDCAWYGRKQDIELDPYDSDICPECSAAGYLCERLDEDTPRIGGMIIGHNNTFGAPGTDTLAHIRDAAEQCQAAGVPVYVKQFWQDGTLLRASHPDEFDKYPEDLKLRFLPWRQPQ